MKMHVNNCVYYIIIVVNWSYNSTELNKKIWND